MPRDTTLQGFGARLTGRPEHDVSMILPQVHLRNGEGICFCRRFCFLPSRFPGRPDYILSPRRADVLRTLARPGPIAV